MEYSKIIAVTGLPGLYELISSKNDGAIVRSLEDNTAKFVSSRVHNFSHLESIEIYTKRDNVNLVDILLEMQNGKQSLPDTKDNAAVKKYFEAIYPDLDFERVYSSDMKKMVKWYEVLKKNEIEIKLSEPPVEEEVPVVAEAPKPKKEKPVKEEAKAAKPAVKKKEPEAKEEKTAKKPAKAALSKTAKQKKEESPAKETAPKKKAAPKKK